MTQNAQTTNPFFKCCNNMKHNEVFLKKTAISLLLYSIQLCVSFFNLLKNCFHYYLRKKPIFILTEIKTLRKWMMGCELKITVVSFSANWNHVGNNFGRRKYNISLSLPIGTRPAMRKRPVMIYLSSKSRGLGQSACLSIGG